MIHLILPYDCTLDENVIGLCYLMLRGLSDHSSAFLYQDQYLGKFKKFQNKQINSKKLFSTCGDQRNKQVLI